MCSGSCSTFFFNDPAPTEIYTLSLHDALPICLESSSSANSDSPSSTGVSRLRTASRTARGDRKSTRLNSSHRCISYAVFCLKKKNELSAECLAPLGSEGAEVGRQLRVARSGPV